MLNLLLLTESLLFLSIGVALWHFYRTLEGAVGRSADSSGKPLLCVPIRRNESNTARFRRSTLCRELVDVSRKQYRVSQFRSNTTPLYTKQFVRNNGTYQLTPFTTESQRRFAAELIAYWVSFVRTGDPNIYANPGSPHWPVWRKGDGKRMVMRQGSERLISKVDAQAVLGSENGGQTKGVLGYDSGSIVEDEPPGELERCRLLNRMAGRLQF